MQSEQQATFPRLPKVLFFFFTRKNIYQDLFFKNFPPNGESADKKKNTHTRQQPPENPLTEPKVGTSICANPAHWWFLIFSVENGRGLKRSFLALFSLSFISLITHALMRPFTGGTDKVPAHLIPFYRAHRIRGDVRGRWRHSHKGAPNQLDSLRPTQPQRRSELNGVQSVTSRAWKRPLRLVNKLPRREPAANAIVFTRRKDLQ